MGLKQLPTQAFAERVPVFEIIHLIELDYLPWCGICGPCFVHNVRCNGWDVPYSSQIRTLCVLAHLHTESSHRAVFHSLDLTEHLHIVRQVRHGRCPVVVVEVLGKRRLCK